jgi:hypothetical protein
MPRQQALDALARNRNAMSDDERKMHDLISGGRSTDETLDITLGVLRDESQTFRRQPIWSPTDAKDQLVTNVSSSGGRTSVGFELGSSGRAWDRFLVEIGFVETAAFVVLALPALVFRRRSTTAP